MRFPLTNVAFVTEFPTSETPGGRGAYGEWNDRDRCDGLELYHTYYVNAAGAVGEWEYNFRTTESKFFVIEGEDADILKHEYRNFRADKDRELAARAARVA